MTISNDKENQLKTELMEAMLEYIDGKRTVRSVVVIGITEYNRKGPVKDQNLAEVISQLNSMGNEIVSNQKFSRENIIEIFTTMLEKLLK